MRYIRQLCGLTIALALILSAMAPARADDESVAMGSAACGEPLCVDVESPELLTDEEPEETVPEETAPEETAPEETVPVETEPEETESSAEHFDWTEVYTHEFPLYSQLDYPNQRFGSGTVATSGCGITSLAMVASYLTGHTYYPDELAKYFGGYGENNVQRFEYGAEQLKLPSCKGRL